MRGFASLALIPFLCLFLVACSGRQEASVSLLDRADATPPSLEEMQAVLMAELERLGKDPALVTSAIPAGAENAVFDLVAQVSDPDGAGPQLPDGVVLHWTERLCADCDANGEVGISDLTPIGLNFANPVQYANPALHDGIACWPDGNPLDESSGTANWYKARVDGDSNGEINMSDITPIAVHWQEASCGYQVYRRKVGDADYQLLPGPVPDDCTAPRSTTYAPGANRPPVGKPVRFSFLDTPAPGSYEYCVALAVADDSGEGPRSNVATASFSVPPTSSFTMDPATGFSPLLVSFDASASSDPDHAIVTYAWDFNGDGTYDETNAVPVTTHEFTDADTYTIRLRVEDAIGEQGASEQQLEVSGNKKPSAALVADKLFGDIPLSVSFDASGSLDEDGTIASYEFDPEATGTFGPPQVSPYFDFTYATEGEFAAAVRVTDNNGATDTATVQIDAGQFDPGGTWNVLVWLAGDNNLAQAAVDDLNEIEQVGSNDQVRILAGFDIDDTWVWDPVTGIDQVNFIKVVHDTSDYLINTTGDPANVSFPRFGYNSADPAHVAEFVQWAETNFPADHTALVLWNHGDGWRIGEEFGADSRRARRDRRALNYGKQASGVLGDDTDGAWSLTANHSIVNALAGRHFDMIWFDACDMGQVEALYDYAALTDWLVASQVLVPNDGYPYTEILSAWNADFPLLPAEIGQLAVDAYISQYAAEFEYVNHAVYDTSIFDALVNSLAGLAAEVTPKAGAQSEAIKSAISSAYVPDGSEGERDLLGFLGAYLTATTDAQVKARIQTAMTATNNFITYFAQYDQPATKGLGAFLPDIDWFGADIKAEYSQLAFNNDTGWLAMFEATGVPGGGGGSLVEADWVPGDKINVDWFAYSLADVDMGITDPDYNWGSPYEPYGLYGVIQFSMDGGPDFLPLEYGVLEDGAPTGDYILDLSWWSYDGFEPPFINVSVTLKDENGNLKQDLGDCMLFLWDSVEFARLTYQP